MIKIPGRPRGKSRPRFHNGHAYTPKTTKEYEKEIRDCYITQDGRKHDGSVTVDIEAIFKIPESWTKKKKWETIDKGKRPEVRPDIDNIVKIVMDALNGIAYDDDSQVVEIKARKIYALGYEGVHINVEEVK